MHKLCKYLTLIIFNGDYSVLLEFRFGNFRSYRNAGMLSLVAGAGKEWHASNTFDTGLNAFPRLLRSGVLYGPNASGKTNLLRALQFFQAFVVGSASSPQPVATTPTATKDQRILVPPFLFDKATRDKPSEFEVVFVEKGVRYQYGFVVNAERVEREWLTAYPEGRPQRWFSREYSHRSKQFTWEIGSKLKGDHHVWRNATRPNALFLSTAIQLNSAQLQPVFHWFQQRLVVVVANSFFNTGITYGLAENSEGKNKLMKFIRAADLGIDDIAVTRQELPAGMVPVPGIPIMGNANGAGGPQFIRLQTLHKVVGDKELATLELGDESAGTQKFLKSAGAMLKVLSEAQVLFVDELDTSLHPLMVRFLVRLFHSNKTNKNNAQLFFTTHDTSLLDADLFRRDQVWFLEKDKTYSSHLYPLTEFSPRVEEVLGKGYLKGRYGALPFIGELRI